MWMWRSLGWAEQDWNGLKAPSADCPLSGEAAHIEPNDQTATFLRNEVRAVKLHLPCAGARPARHPPFADAILSDYQSPATECVALEAADRLQREPSSAPRKLPAQSCGCASSLAPPQRVSPTVTQACARRSFSDGNAEAADLTWRASMPDRRENARSVDSKGPSDSKAPGSS
jgi:hypothetical protein